MSVDGTERVLWQVPIAPPIAFAESMIGEQIETTIGGAAAVIHLPVRQSGSYVHLTRPLLLEEHVPDSEYANYQDEDNVFPDSPWGQLSSFGGANKDPNVAFVSQLGIEAQQESASPLTSVDIDEWLDSIRRWTGIIAMQDLKTDAPKPAVKLTPGWMTWDATGVRKSLFFHGLEINHEPGEPLDLPTFRQILTSTAEEASPRLELLLLSNARSCHRRSWYREAILDAGLSIELALHHLLRLQAAGNALAERMVERQRWTMGSLEIALAGTGAIPLDTKEAVTTRNRVAHGKDLGDEKQSSAIIRTAAEICSTFDLLPQAQ